MEETKEAPKQDKKAPAKAKNKVFKNLTNNKFKCGDFEVEAGAEKELTDYQVKNSRLNKILDRQVEIGKMEIKK